jgi:hypothetical protein
LDREAKVGGAENTVDQEATMDADLDYSLHRRLPHG